MPDQGSKLSVEIFVLSHLKNLLASCPSDPALVPIDLTELEIPSNLRGSHLGEMRIFFAPLLDQTSALTLGMVSARWNERCPSFPSLDKLPDLAARLRPDEFIAPNAEPIVTRRKLRHWIYLQESTHPGIGPILREICHRESIFSERVLGSSVLGGQLVLSRARFLDLRDFLLRNLEPYIDKYGVSPPISYRCPICGFQSSSGLGRWTDERRLGYLAERIVSLYFIRASTLTNIFAIHMTRKSIFTQSIALYLPSWAQNLASEVSFRLMRRKVKCNH